MNKTRKEIIELISDYMDKTLWVWCIVLFEEHISWMIEPFKPKYIIIWSEHWLPNWRTVEIIWHYDITAVFDYINSINLHWIWPYYFDSISFSKHYYILTPTGDNDYARIPRKPLNLYTDTEEKELLELLKKLWTLCII